MKEMFYIDDIDKSMLSMISSYESVIIPSMEAAVDTESIEETEEHRRKALELGLLTDDIIMSPFNNLKCVSNPVNFERNRIPTAGGLFSEEIFGTTLQERKKQLAYIDLHHKFLHPYVYEVISRFFPNIEQIASGNGVWKLDDKKHIVKVNKGEEGYNPENTGMEWLLKVIDKVEFEENDSFMRKERLRFFNNIKKAKHLFISKWIVIPISYRDVNLNAKALKNSEINKMYSKIIRYCNSLTEGEVGFVSNLALFNIQKALIEIRRYGQKLVEKKTGFLKKSVLGKSVDYGYRSVISVPNMVHYETPDDCPIDIFHTGVPLSQCCTLAFPYILNWVVDFFRRNLEEAGAMYPSYDKDGNITMKELDNPMLIFTEEYIRKMINRFIDSPNKRFDKIPLKFKDGTMGYMAFTGTGYDTKKNQSTSATISQRPLTWTDIIYMACYHQIEENDSLHLYLSRYPISDFQGFFASRVHVLSTMKTFPMYVNGRVYKYYPIINFNLSDSAIESSFIDTTTMSNAMLEAIGGDYDGDQVSDKFVFTLEANQEAEDIMHSLKNFLSLAGNVIRNTKNEAFLTCYAMTQ